MLLQSIPTHIMTGFLGAGKTTLLRELFLQKPTHEVWAVLMNEFGEIGIDQTWIAEQGIAVKEVLGGCLCCTSQLPMQIALARLLSDYRPHRLFIEPTGLGHPKTLVEQLCQSHWQSTLTLQSVVNVLDGARLHQRLWLQHEVFSQQLETADVVVISHQEQMNPLDHIQLARLKSEYPTKHWLSKPIQLAQLIQPHQPIKMQKKHLLTPILKHHAGEQAQSDTPKSLPYHYQHQQQGYYVAGWHLPKAWTLDVAPLLTYLQQLPHLERIKGKILGEQGWIDINAIPRQFSVDYAAKPGIDNRLEIISSTDHDWLAIENLLLSNQVN